MSDWRLSANSTNYREALRATETIHPPAVGFVRPQDITGKATEVQFKQNNTIIQLLLKLTEEVEDLKVAVKRLEIAKGKEVTQPNDLSDSLDQIQQQLQKLSLDEHSKFQQRLYIKLDGQKTDTGYTNITRMKEHWSQMASKWSYHLSLKKALTGFYKKGSNICISD
ncbi:hypothetical protein LUZ63_005836 [Rhynchospora breviuscula]|uniref:Uncharacterized protein n=1 Tax=Rhynchospora breviuscula TaxID=2022672 RepID=A0A9Q0CPT3_9POAL|nr:hypothetical protein LUZ63_005836 [Rhynchospora breviuscula]